MVSKNWFFYKKRYLRLNGIVDRCIVKSFRTALKELETFLLNTLE